MKKNIDIIIQELRNLQRFDVIVSSNPFGVMEEVVEDSEGTHIKFEDIEELINRLKENKDD